MAGASRYTALLDANVLFDKLQRDAMLSLAHAGLYVAKWSAHIRLRIRPGFARCAAKG